MSPDCSSAAPGAGVAAQGISGGVCRRHRRGACGAGHGAPGGFTDDHRGAADCGQAGPGCAADDGTRHRTPTASAAAPLWRRTGNRHTKVRPTGSALRAAGCRTAQFCGMSWDNRCRLHSDIRHSAGEDSRLRYIRPAAMCRRQFAHPGPARRCTQSQVSAIMAVAFRTLGRRQATGTYTVSSVGRGPCVSEILQVARKIIHGMLVQGLHWMPKLLRQLRPRKCSPHRWSAARC